MDQKIKQDYYIGANLRRLRKQAGLTQEQAAARLQVEGIDMTRDFYAHIEAFCIFKNQNTVSWTGR